MKVELKDDGRLCEVQDAIASEFRDSRFEIGSSTAHGSTIKLLRIRLRDAKQYCGNHAKACERAFEGKHKKTRYLEGADWVEFNDRLNDVLDRLELDADVHSTVCIVRKGRRRRISYDATNFIGVPGDGEWRWDRDADDGQFEDRCGKETKEASWFPEGTPGRHDKMAYFEVG